MFLVDWAVKMRIRPPEFETSICDAKYHVSLPDEGVSDLVVDRIGDNLPQSTEKSRIIVITVGARHKCQRACQPVHCSVLHRAGIVRAGLLNWPPKSRWLRTQSLLLYSALDLRLSHSALHHSALELCSSFTALDLRAAPTPNVRIAIGSIATLDLPMVVDPIGIYGLKGPYCTLTTTNWFLQALSVIPRDHGAMLLDALTMIRWASPEL
ncbi:TMV resistance protein N-like [Dorcoceras hygrometricum]|uniref:TMV resistance protein N-like n=1 Tax=Dorcoceras hygrometricum TaxID=472368 RepID=A0A2Z7CH00_9LAMI|nr:TMV resistance protein N-like [Dorcoceras hygrometricum]